MSTPYVGEIRMFGGNFAPTGWQLCQGQLLSIAENEVLFNLIGTIYGGDGQTTFGLPNLASRIPIHAGSGYSLSATGGTESVTLLTSQLPVHNHPAKASSAAGTTTSPANAVWSAGTYAEYSDTPATNTTMSSSAISQAGSSQPHENMPPFLAVNFIISLFGIFPSQS